MPRQPHVVTSESLNSHNELTVGDLVWAPGHGRNIPPAQGTLVDIERMHFARGLGYFAKIEIDGRIVTAAIGLVRKAEQA